MKPIVILSAISEEIEDFLTHFKLIESQDHAPIRTYHTMMNSTPLIFSTSGVGKVSAR